MRVKEAWSSQDRTNPGRTKQIIIERLGFYFQSEQMATHIDKSWESFVGNCQLSWVKFDIDIRRMDSLIDLTEADLDQIIDFRRSDSPTRKIFLQDLLYHLIPEVLKDRADTDVVDSVFASRQLAEHFTSCWGQFLYDAKLDFLGFERALLEIDLAQENVARDVMILDAIKSLEGSLRFSFGRDLAIQLDRVAQACLASDSPDDAISLSDQRAITT